jgi:hypothetical protein
VADLRQIHLFYACLGQLRKEGFAEFAAACAGFRPAAQIR